MSRGTIPEAYLATAFALYTSMPAPGVAHDEHDGDVGHPGAAA